MSTLTLRQQSAMLQAVIAIENQLAGVGKPAQLRGALQALLAELPASPTGAEAPELAPCTPSPIPHPPPPAPSA